MSDTAGNGAVLVVGGGMSGLTAALEAAEVGSDVFLVEQNAYLGGRVAQLNQYFPKLCPNLRAGDQFQTHQGQPQNQNLYAHHSHLCKRRPR